MSHDQKKDLTFNQKYAGRSRVRRDLNTIKDVLPASTGTASGVTRYNVGPLVGGTMQMATVNFGPSYGTTIGTGPNATTTFASLNSNNALQVCLWRGPRDSSVNAPADGLATKSQIIVHKVLMFVTTQWDGTTSATIVVGNGGGNASFQSDSAYIDGTVNLHNVDSTSLYALPSTTSNAGDANKWGVWSGWTDDDERNAGANDGVAPANGGLNEGTADTFAFSGDNALYNHGVWVKLALGSGKDCADLTAGGIQLQIFYTLIAD